MNKKKHQGVHRTASGLSTPWWVRDEARLLAYLLFVVSLFIIEFFDNIGQ